MDIKEQEIKRIDEAINCIETATREDFFSYLMGEDEVLMQIALLNLQDVVSVDEAQKIVNTLTEHSSETREYAAFLINRLMKNEEFVMYFNGEFILDSFAKAISDVNPKVCRKIIEILPKYIEMKELYPLLVKNSFEFIGGLTEKNKNKNYQYNTLSFRLYWTIFALGYAVNEEYLNIYETDLINLLKQLCLFREYTLREKAAYLAQKISSIRKISEVEDCLKLCANDENFFVKEIVD